MPRAHLTAQQEAFAREYVSCGVGATAYRRAYKVAESTTPNAVYCNASKLLANAKIRQRITYMQEKLAEVTVGELATGFRQARDIALEDRVPAAVTGAVTQLGKLRGFFKDDPAQAGDIHIHFDAALKSVL
jgi:phage terminase small subunit